MRAPKPVETPSYSHLQKCRESLALSFFLLLSLVVPNGVLNLSGLAFPRDSVEIIRESWQEEH